MKLLGLCAGTVKVEFMSIQPQQYDVAPSRLDLLKSSIELSIDKNLKFGVECRSVQKKLTNIDLFVLCILKVDSRR